MMYTHDVVQIVDTYPRYHEKRRQTTKIDPDVEAQSLSMLVKPLGRNERKIAIVAQDDDRRLLAYQRVGYETYRMNGNRPTELKQFIQHITTQIKQAPPKHLVLVSEDPAFVQLCDAVASLTDLAVWANSVTVPRELIDPNYGWRPLEELLPSLKIARIDVRIDLENIFIGLVKRGWRPDLNDMIEAIRLAADNLGEVVTVTGYADFDELNRRYGGPKINWQRELTIAGGESRYVINRHGKNTADMKIADDIRTLLERDLLAGSAIDIIVLVTMDRDFRHVVDTSKSRGKTVVVLGLEGEMSRELAGAASEVIYLDRFLKLTQPSKPDAERILPLQREDIALMMRIAAWMHRNRWRFVYTDRLEQKFGRASERLHKLIADGWLIPSPSGSIGAKGQSKALKQNPNNPVAQAAHYLARWIPTRLDYCLNQKGMLYVDTSYLAKGMAHDKALTQMDIGQMRGNAEAWLYAAASAGLVVPSKQPHPQKPAKIITIWRLPEEITSSPTAEDAETRRITSSYLRQLLTQGLSDSELARLILDYFQPVYMEVEHAPKFVRIQALLEHVDRYNLRDRLLAIIREINPALGYVP